MDILFEKGIPGFDHINILLLINLKVMKNLSIII